MMLKLSRFGVLLALLVMTLGLAGGASAQTVTVFSFNGTVGSDTNSHIGVWGSQGGNNNGYGNIGWKDTHIVGTFTGTKLELYATTPSAGSGNQWYAFIDGSTSSTVFTPESTSAQWMTGPTGLADTKHTFDLFSAVGNGAFGYDPLFRVTGTNPAMGPPSPRTGATWPNVIHFGTTTNFIVAVGDSRTFGQNSSYPGRETSGTDYPADLYSSLGSGYYVAQQGISGAVDSLFLLNGAPDVDTQYNPVNKSNTVIFWGGYNDAYSGQTLAQMQASTTSYVQSRHQVGWKVVVGTIPDAGGSTILAQFNAWLLSPSDPAGCDNVSNIAALPALALPASSTYWGSDNIHFTDAGYSLIAGQFKSDYLTLLSGTNLKDLFVRVNQGPLTASNNVKGKENEIF